jgi:hypothetical protein
MTKVANYVFIGDQGRVFSSFDEPTADDLEYCAVGMLTVVSLRDLRYYGRECRWLPIEERAEVGDERPETRV